MQFQNVTVTSDENSRAHLSNNFDRLSKILALDVVLIAVPALRPGHLSQRSSYPGTSSTMNVSMRVGSPKSPAEAPSVPSQ